MSLYRVLKPLQTKHGIVQQGNFIPESAYSPESIAKLEEVGAIGVLHAPPLSELPGFEGAEQLATIGIVNADQFLEANIETTIDRLGIDAAVLHQWRATVSKWLILPVTVAG